MTLPTSNKIISQLPLFSSMRPEKFERQASDSKHRTGFFAAFNILEFTK